MRTKLSCNLILFWEFISHRNGKNMNKPVYLGLSILEINKVVMYEFWHGYVELKFGEKAKLCHMDTGSFIVYIKTDLKDVKDVKYIVKDVETKYNTLDCESERLLPKGKTKK